MELIMSQVLESPTKSYTYTLFLSFSIVCRTRNVDDTQACSLAIYSNNSNLTITEMYFILFNWKLCMFVNVLHLPALIRRNGANCTKIQMEPMCNCIMNWTTKYKCKHHRIILIRRNSPATQRHYTMHIAQHTHTGTQRNMYNWTEKIFTMS